MQQNFFQRHLIVEWLFNSILKIRQNRFGETWEKLAIKIFNSHHRKPNFRKITNSEKHLIIVFYFFRDFWYNIASVFWVVLILKTLTWCVRNTRLSVSSWRLCTGYPATCLSSYSVFQALIVFSMTVFQREIISQSVLTWLKTNWFFLAQYQKCSKYFSSFTGW